MPIIFKRNTTSIALYSLGYVEDEKLSKMFCDNLITFSKKPNNSVAILIIHQTKYNKENKLIHNKSFKDEFIPDFIDLVIFGHETECQIEFKNLNAIKISQPGSSIATNLSYKQSTNKHIGLLTITNKTIIMKP